MGEFHFKKGLFRNKTENAFSFGLKGCSMSYKIAIRLTFLLFIYFYFSDIDPDDESTESYGRDIFNYVLIRDAKYIVTSDDIISKDDPKACPSLYRTI